MPTTEIIKRKVLTTFKDQRDLGATPGIANGIVGYPLLEVSGITMFGRPHNPPKSQMLTSPAPLSWISFFFVDRGFNVVDDFKGTRKYCSAKQMSFKEFAFLYERYFDIDEMPDFIGTAARQANLKNSAREHLLLC